MNLFELIGVTTVMGTGCVVAMPVVRVLHGPPWLGVVAGLLLGVSLLITLVVTTGGRTRGSLPPPSGPAPRRRRPRRPPAPGAGPAGA